tara:strand:- start:563 stop:901 length:339 start_codon:yes stop_codon:yes gene_type:complete
VDIHNHIVISLTSYKLLSLLSGCAFAYMGYRLFVSGIWGHTGDLEAEFGDNRLVLKKAAPGTFFALFGAVIVSVTLYKGLEFKDYSKSKVETESFVEFTGEKSDEMPEKPPI